MLKKCPRGGLAAVALIGVAVAAASPARAQAATAAARDANGVYADSRFRLPLPRREALDADGQKAYDQAVGVATDAGRGRSGAGTGLKGPSGILLYSPQLAKLSIDTNYYLRFRSGLDDRMREIAILAVSREADNDFEWTQHVAIARRVGVEEPVIAILATRGALRGLGEQDATVVSLVREAVTDHRVSVKTYDRALSLLGPEKLVNLTNIVGNYLANAVLLTTFGMTLPADQPSSLPQRATIRGR